MPGGSEKAWSEVKPIRQSIAAKAPDGTPCCQGGGPAGSGHFVKMIHNGIELSLIHIYLHSIHVAMHYASQCIDTDTIQAVQRRKPVSYTHLDVYKRQE